MNRGGVGARDDNPLDCDLLVVDETSMVRRIKIASLKFANDAKDSAVAERLAAQGGSHIREEGRAVIRGQRRSGAPNLFELGVG
jgi:hypothetical protein